MQIKTRLSHNQTKQFVFEFQRELFFFIDTALHLHLLGHDLPIIIMNLIEKQHQLILNIKTLDSLLEVFNEIVGRMDAPIVSMAYLLSNEPFCVQNIAFLKLLLIFNIYHLFILNFQNSNFYVYIFCLQ